MLTKPAILMLGIIHITPTNAYEMVKTIHKLNIEWWFDISESTIYSTLRKLEKQELVVGDAKKEGNMPVKMVYTISEKGNEELFESLRELLTGFDYDMTGFTLAALFLDLFKEEEIKEMLHKRLDILKDKRTKLDTYIHELTVNKADTGHIIQIKRMKELVWSEENSTLTIVKQYEM